MPPRPSGSSSRYEPKVRPARLRIVMRRSVSWLPRPLPRRGFATLERIVQAAGTRYGAGEANGFSTSGKYVTGTPNNATRDGRAVDTAARGCGHQTRRRGLGPDRAQSPAGDFAASRGEPLAPVSTGGHPRPYLPS